VVEMVHIRVEIKKQDFRKDSLRYPWQLITMGGSIRVFFRFLSNEPKASALWARLAFWILNISLTVTPWADYHAVFLRLKNLLVHFSPRAEILLSFFPFLSIHQGIRLR
jgi:hypothetical protein